MNLINVQLVYKFLSTASTTLGRTKLNCSWQYMHIWCSRQFHEKIVNDKVQCFVRRNNLNAEYQYVGVD